MRHRVRHATEDGGEGGDDSDSKEPEVEAHRMRHRVRHASEEGTEDSTEPDVEAHRMRH
jgi:hypothetical protein